MIVEIGSNRYDLMKWDSVSEQIDYALDYSPAHYADFPITQILANRSFVGRRWNSLENLRADCNDKDEDILKMLFENKDKMEEVNSPESIRLKLVPSMAGMLSIQGYIQRKKYPFVGFERKHKVSNKIVTILAPISSSAKYTATNIAYKSLATLLCCDTLENAGYSCNIYLLDAGIDVFYNKMGSINLTKLKDCSEPLNLASLSASLSPWYFRTVGFAATKRLGKKVKCGFGIATSDIENGRITQFLSAELGKSYYLDQSYTLNKAIEVANKLIKEVEDDTL